MEMLLPEETQLNSSGKNTRMVRISPQTVVLSQLPRPLCPLRLGKEPLLLPNATPTLPLGTAGCPWPLWEREWGTEAAEVNNRQ